MPADITHSSRTIPRPYRTGKGSPRIVHLQPSTCVSTSLIHTGDVVQYDVNTASNAFRIVKASSGSISSGIDPVLSTAIIGIAGGNDDSDGSTLGLNARPTIPVFLGESDSEFLWPTRCTVAQHTSTLANTVARAINYDSTNGIFYLNLANSSAGDAKLRITEVYDPGSSNGYVVARFLSTAISMLTIR